MQTNNRIVDDRLGVSLPAAGRYRVSDAPCAVAPPVGAEVAKGDEGFTGLVSFTTSDIQATRSYSERIINGSVAFIDPHRQRTAKCRKSLLNAARLVVKDMQSRKTRFKAAMYTLTYKNIEDWKPGHISEYIRHVRQYLAVRGHDTTGIWKTEIQERGAVHYHVIFWLPKGVSLPKPDKQGWWKHGMTKSEWLRNGYGYVAKYISKDENKLMPKGARMFGLLGLSKDQKREIRWWNTPAYIREQWPIEHDPVRAKGGGWMSRLTGEIQESGWQFSGFEFIDGSRLIRFVKAERVTPETIDLTVAAQRQQESDFWRSMGQSLKLKSDRIGWLQDMEKITGMYQ